MKDEDIAKALANLQLPHMPFKIDLSDPSQSLPSIRILVVADVDLTSAAALAEFFLQQQQEIHQGRLDSSRVDLCIACGPFGREDDVRPYMTGKQLQRRQQKQFQQQYNADKASNNMSAFQNSNNTRATRGTAAAATTSASPGHPNLPYHIETPFSRSREETSGLEGLLTASLSQLEAIVCRVVYCPGFSDPITSMASLSSSSSSSAASFSHRRLTPNSRNIHRQWLPIAPALGCAGLLYLDSTHVVVGNKAHRKSRRRKFSDSSDDDDGRWTEDEAELLTEKMIDTQQR